MLRQYGFQNGRIDLFWVERKILRKFLKQKYLTKQTSESDTINFKEVVWYLGMVKLGQFELNTIVGFQTILTQEPITIDNIRNKCLSTIKVKFI